MAGIAAFHGSYVLGMGSMVDPERAQSSLHGIHAIGKCYSHYLNGQDLNTRPDCSASRWVINFHDWSGEQSEDILECYDQVLRW